MFISAVLFILMSLVCLPTTATSTTADPTTTAATTADSSEATTDAATTTSPASTSSYETTSSDSSSTAADTTTASSDTTDSGSTSGTGGDSTTTSSSTTTTSTSSSSSSTTTTVGSLLDCYDTICSEMSTRSQDCLADQIRVNRSNIPNCTARYCKYERTEALFRISISASCSNDSCASVETDSESLNQAATRTFCCNANDFCNFDQTHSTAAVTTPVSKIVVATVLAVFWTIMVSE